MIKELLIKAIKEHVKENLEKNDSYPVVYVKETNKSIFFHTVALGKEYVNFETKDYSQNYECSYESLELEDVFEIAYGLGLIALEV